MTTERWDCPHGCVPPCPFDRDMKPRILRLEGYHTAARVEGNVLRAGVAALADALDRQAGLVARGVLASAADALRASATLLRVWLDEVGGSPAPTQVTAHRTAYLRDNDVAIALTLGELLCLESLVRTRRSEHDSDEVAAVGESLTARLFALTRVSPPEGQRR